MSVSEPEQPPAGAQPPEPADPGVPASGPGGPAGPPGPPLDQPPGPPPAAPAPRRGRTRRALLEWVAILVVAVLAAVILRTFVIQPYFIPSGSMETTLKVNDKVLVNKLSYDFHGIHRGDVVVFKKPPNDFSPGITDLIKRVIGLPGETVSALNGSVYVNGKLLKEPWLPKADRGVTQMPSTIPGCLPSPPGSCRVPAGDYFMMGDNRGNSADSRVIGPIPGKLVVGRAFMIIWPISRIGGL